jgi:hypothetical protein
MNTEMYKIIPEGKCGTAEIQHVEVSKEASQFTMLRAMQHPGAFVPPGIYVHLLIKGRLYMSDTRNERITNYEVIRKATGDVLIAGLGIGMILADILAKPEVTSVTVVEINPDVVALVGDAVKAMPGGEKLTVVTEDIFKYKPAKDQKYDVIYFDIWADQSGDERKEVTRLHRRGAWWRKPGGWMASWQVKGRPMVARTAERYA